MIIGIDFDGTCVTHAYPVIGKDIGAVPVLKKIVDKGHQLILYTMRSKKELEDAIDWFKKHKIELYAVNENPTQKEWTKSPKIYCNLYIDDAGLGIPLLYSQVLNDRPFVDWMQTEKLLSSFPYNVL